MDLVFHVFLDMLYFLFRWSHVLFGVAWIGLLYYFNFVQGAYMAAASDEGRVDAFTKLVPNALWWFRWAAMMTFLTGLVLLYFLSAFKLLSVGIWLGSLMAIVMFLNVWLIIWPNQKVVIASNEAVRDGGAADPNQGSAAASALLASRTNTLLSVPMLYLMVASAHYFRADVAENAVALWVGVAIVAAIEANAIWGKTGPIATVKGVIWSSLALTVVMMFLNGFDVHTH